MIWLIGDKGMLGSDVSQALDAGGFARVGSDREVDITEPSALRRYATGKDIRWIVNCVAYTAVDRAEEEAEAAFALNTEGAGNVAELAESLGARLIHMSTDYVFDGSGSAPYREDDPVGPGSVYGQSKAAGESAALRRCSRTYILRTSWLYAPRGKNFLLTMLKLMQERDSLKVVDDQIASPTYTADLAGAISSIVQASLEEYGIYHFSNEGQTTWFRFAREIYTIARRKGVMTNPCLLEACATRDFPAKARRPAYSVLSKEKIKQVFGLSIRSWQAGLRACFDRLLEEHLP